MQVRNPFAGWIRNSRDRFARTSMTQTHQVDSPGEAQDITESGSRRASDFRSAALAPYRECARGYVDQWVAFSERMSLWKE